MQKVQEVSTRAVVKHPIRTGITVHENIVHVQCTYHNKIIKFISDLEIEYLGINYHKILKLQCTLLSVAFSYVEIFIIYRSLENLVHVNFS